MREVVILLVIAAVVGFVCVALWRLEWALGVLERDLRTLAERLRRVGR